MNRSWVAFMFFILSRKEVDNIKTNILTKGLRKEGALMIKTGKNRIISMLLVMAMVIGMVPAAAFAGKVSTTPTKPEIAVGATAGVAGDITIEETGTSEWGTADRNITFTLPAGVTFANVPTATKNSSGGLVIKDVSTNGTDVVTVKVAGDNTDTDKFTLSNIKYAVAPGTSTGDVTVTIGNAGPTAFTTKNATIVDGFAAAAVSKPDVTVGQSNQAAGNITFAESAVGLLNKDATVSITLPAGVTFYQAPSASATTGNLVLTNAVATLSNGNQTATWTVKTASTVKSTITMTDIAYNVADSVAAGDISVTVATNDSEPVNPSTVKNAKAVLTGSTTVTATSKSVTAGSSQSAGTVTITENKAGVLEATKTITLVLGGSVKFASAPVAEVTNIELESNTATLDTSTYQTATWTVKTDSTSAATIKLKDIFLNVPAGTSGDIAVTVGGTAGVTGTKTIATAAASAIASVVADSQTVVKKNAANQAAGAITITEGAAGSLTTGNNIYLIIFGQNATDKAITFGKLPKAAVTSGNLTPGTVAKGSNDWTIVIPVTTGTKASTINISDIVYDITSKAADGDITVDVRYGATEAGSTRLATVSNATFDDIVIEPTFPDVASSHWAATYIEGLVTAGIISGYTDGTFKPSNHITRAEFAKIACVAAGLSPISGDASFSDTAGHWAAGYIEAAKAAGIIGGYADGTFRPNAMITRAEIAKIVVGAAGLATDTSGAGFSDIAGHWASDYILTAANNGIVGGYTDGTFKPNAHATRAEASKMVYMWITM